MVIRCRHRLGQLRRDLVHARELVGDRRRQLLAGGALGDAGADLLGQGQLSAQVVRLAGADPEVGADGGEAVLVAQAGAGLPAVAKLLLLVDEAEVLAGVVDLRLDAADLLGRGRVVEQQHDQASDRLEALVALGAAQLVALGGGQVAALAVIEHDRLVLAGAVADARHQLTGPREHRGQPVDAFG